MLARCCEKVLDYVKVGAEFYLSFNSDVRLIHELSRAIFAPSKFIVIDTPSTIRYNQLFLFPTFLPTSITHKSTPTHIGKEKTAYETVP